MNRRAFIAGLGGAAAWPLVAHGQQTDRSKRIGVLLGLAESDPQYQRYVSAFTLALRDLGWLEGRNIQIDYRAAGGDRNRAEAFAKELLGLHPDLIVPHTDMSVVAFRGLTRSVPMVFVSTADPVVAGYVASYPHPGG